MRGTPKHKQAKSDIDNYSRVQKSYRNQATMANTTKTWVLGLLLVGWNVVALSWRPADQ